VAREIELKLEVPPSALARLKRAPWLIRHAEKPGEDTRLISVYYDTDKGALKKRRATLRVRDADGAFLQTFKRDSTGLGRLEWECPLDDPSPKLTHAARKKTGGLDIKKLAGSLKPVFETNVRRHVMPLSYRDSQLELALDRGKIKTGRRRLAVHEVEIELKRGDSGDVVALGREIAARLKPAYGVASKAERGYALKDGCVGAPVSADIILLSRDMNAAEAFQTIAMSALHHFAANRDAVIAQEGEGVHQMRVGLRRLRAAISIFKTLLRGPETQAVKASLKWLTEALGPARDMDVLAKDGVAPMAKETPAPVAAKVLKADIAGRREAGFARARKAVTSERYRRLVLDTVLWINGGKWVRSGVALIAGRRMLSARRFAARELGRRTAKVLKKLSRIDELNPPQQHKLRIAIKKLRYGVGFFESLFAGEKKRIKQFAGVLKDLQSALGKLNDIRVHGRLAKAYAAPAKPTRRAAPRAFAMGELTGKERAMGRDCLAAARKQGKRLKHCPHFWT